MIMYTHLYLCSHQHDFRFNLSGSTMTLILNLSVCDLLYCGITLPIYAAQHLSGRPIVNENICKITAVFRNIYIEADFMSIGLIAISRLVRCTNGNTKSFLDNHCRIFVAWTWFYGIIMVVARYLVG